MDRRKIKNKLNNIPENLSLRDIELSWVELIIDRLSGNRRQAALALGISMCKMRRYITHRKIDSPNLKTVGRPRKET